MRRAMEWSYWLLTVAMGLFFCCVAIWFMRQLGVTGDVAAAWVQAIGSVLAIVAAVYIANGQHRTAERIRLASERARYAAIGAIVERAHYAVGLVEAAWLARPMDNSGWENTSYLLDARAALLTLPIFEIPDAVLVGSITALPRLLQELVDFLHQAYDARSVPYFELMFTDADLMARTGAVFVWTDRLMSYCGQRASD